MLVAAPAEHDGNADTPITPVVSTHNLQRLPGQADGLPRAAVFGRAGPCEAHSGLVRRPSSSVIASSTDSPL
ncbi:Uncharacterised protein [Mycobacterium tuberculosis]|nr:Uncharacterised protein [Mycobacterium tuberculosis]